MPLTKVLKRWSIQVPLFFKEVDPGSPPNKATVGTQALLNKYSPLRDSLSESGI